MILFIKIESSCHNINFLQFTFVKHGTQALSTNYCFPTFITSLVLQWQDGVRSGGWQWGEDGGQKGKRARMGSGDILLKTALLMQLCVRKNMRGILCKKKLGGRLSGSVP